MSIRRPSPRSRDNRRLLEDRFAVTVCPLADAESLSPFRWRTPSLSPSPSLSFPLSSSLFRPLPPSCLRRTPLRCSCMRRWLAVAAFTPSPCSAAPPRRHLFLSRFREEVDLMLL
ncbi:hypothetical protein AAHA92_33886 [Salvia divinorum]|uniref:Uncharacterized protein n=1 Tax=Salvia divinorum TaxID=28513 RepID=A0ABD1FH68_SALDI